MISIGGSPGVLQHGASINVMNDIEYSSFISLVAMNLTPLVTAFPQSIGMILFKTVTFLFAIDTKSCQVFICRFLYAGLSQPDV